MLSLRCHLQCEHPSPAVPEAVSVLATVTDHICCCSRVQSSHLCRFVEPESVRLNEVVQLCSNKAAEKAKHQSWDLLSSVSQWCYCPRKACVSNLPRDCVVQDIPGVTHHSSAAPSSSVLLSLRGSNFLGSPAPPGSFISSSREHFLRLGGKLHKQSTSRSERH